MMSLNLVTFVFALFISASHSASFRAGTGKVDIGNDLVVLGCPLAGYNHGARRVPYWPLPVPRRQVTRALVSFNSSHSQMYDLDGA